MKTARPVPSRPPMAFVTGRRRTSRSAAISTCSPTATAAAVSSPDSALTVTNATGPTPVSTIARRSRRSSNGLGGLASGDGAPGSGSGLGLGGRKHQVVEEPRREASLEQLAVDALEQQIAAVGVVDPGHRDPLRVRAGLERAVEPPEPVGQQLLAADADLLEARTGRVALEVSGNERVHVDLALEVVVVV